MARGNARKKQFLTTHPVCCFCGGETPAATWDHIPSRATFVGRQWPDGYVFPACVSCNAVSAREEQVVAILSRMGRPNPSALEMEEFEEQLGGLRRNLPMVLEEMRPTARVVRRFLRSRNLQLEPGHSTDDVPILSVAGPLVVAAVNSFARKLFLALHYKHTNQILPHTGGIALKWITNATKDDSDLVRDLESIHKLLPQSASLIRANTNLQDQFRYKYYVNQQADYTVIFAFFGNTLAMLGMIRSDELTFPEFMLENGIMKPYAYKLDRPN